MAMGEPYWEVSDQPGEMLHLVRMRELRLRRGVGALSGGLG